MFMPLSNKDNIIFLKRVEDTFPNFVKRDRCVCFTFAVCHSYNVANIPNEALGILVHDTSYIVILSPVPLQPVDIFHRDVCQACESCDCMVLSERFRWGVMLSVALQRMLWHIAWISRCFTGTQHGQYYVGFHSVLLKSVCKTGPSLHNTCTYLDTQDILYYVCSLSESMLQINASSIVCEGAKLVQETMCYILV